MPVPAAPISYPSLPPLDPPSKDLPTGPKTPTSNSSIPVPTAVKTSRKAAPATSMPGAFGVPSDFAFDFKSELGEYGRKILEEVKDKARDYRAQMENDPITPPSHLARSPSKQSVTTTRRKTRFSDVHREQFAKMESIADHYAVKKTKLVTPQNPQKGIKRTQSQATLDGKSPARTPSPVKKQRDQELAMQQEEGRRSKRVKMDPVSSFSAKIGSIVTTPKNKSGPLTSAARTAAASRIARPLPALPRAVGIEPTVKLVPSNMPRSPSKIPVTPSFRRLNIAPATVGAAPKFSLSKIPQTAAPKAAANAPSVDTPEKSKAGITMGGLKPKAVENIKKSGDITSTASDKMSLPRTHTGVLSPVKITETVALEDPFASSDLRQNSNCKDWGFVAPAGNPVMPELFPKVPTHEPWSKSTKPQVSALPAPAPAPAPAVNKDSKKRKDMDSASAEDGKDDDDATIDECATPARKKARFAPAAAAAQGVKNVMEKGRALIDKARLDFLATPKRRLEKPRGAKSAVKKGAKKPTWK
jgi:hypothetical protein